MKDTWRWIERGMSIAAIIGMFIVWRSDTKVWQKTIEDLTKSDEKQEEYIKNQNEINGKFIILYDYFIRAGAEEENEGP